MPGSFSVNTSRSSDCLRDHFLLAMPCLSEGIFSHSITYICEHGESGAMGIVINQPLDLSLEEIFEHLQISASHDFTDSPVMAGGPVQIDHGFVLHRNCDKTWEASLKVTTEITLTTSRDILRAIAKEEGPGDQKPGEEVGRARGRVFPGGANEEIAGGDGDRATDLGPRPGPVGHHLLVECPRR